MLICFTALMATKNALPGSLRVKSGQFWVRKNKVPGAKNENDTLKNRRQNARMSCQCFQRVRVLCCAASKTSYRRAGDSIETKPHESRRNISPLEEMLGRFEVRVGSAIGKKRLSDSQRRSWAFNERSPHVTGRPLRSLTTGSESRLR